jgi:hypothetical protein
VNGELNMQNGPNVYCRDGGTYQLSNHTVEPSTLQTDYVKNKKCPEINVIAKPEYSCKVDLRQHD